VTDFRETASGPGSPRRGSTASVGPIIIPVIIIITGGQHNLTTGRIDAAHGRFDGIEGTVAPPGE